MNTSLFSGRRAQHFARLVDSQDIDDQQNSDLTSTDQDFRDLVALARRISDLPMPVEPVPEFRDGLRAVLMATIEREGIGVTAIPECESKSQAEETARATVAALAERQWARRRIRAFALVITGLATAVLALSGVSLASTDAVPGDPLYAFKRQAERAQLAFSGSDVGKGELYLDFATTRLNEARAVADDPAEFDSILDEMDLETQEGVKILTVIALNSNNSEALDLIDVFVDEQQTSIAQISTSDPTNQDRITESAVLLEKIADRSAVLRPVLACGSHVTDGEDELGPFPAPTATCDIGNSDANKNNHSLTGSHDSGSSASHSSTTPSSRSVEEETTSQTTEETGPSESPNALDGAGLNGIPSDVIAGLPG